MANKPSIPKGTRDFGPAEMAKRNYIFETIRSVFKLHGFVPIETPAMELRDTLLGKYGEEGDKLIFNILNNGDYLGKTGVTDLSTINSEQFTGSIAERALRYDLTVPFARFVVQHQHTLSFPFKRYQIQPVWRADRPQKGRYREFYQCDIDIIGSNSLWNEVELIQVIQSVFERLQLKDTVIKLNNRKVLQGIAETIGQPDKFVAITIALDKLDKLPQEKVLAELADRGIPQDALDKLTPLLSDSLTLENMRAFLSDSEIGQQGLTELDFVLEEAARLGCTQVQPEFTLARGLNYYTGAILEVTHPAFPSSITGGGRYDDLTGIFGLPNLSGVGISFGADRIYDLLEQEDLFPTSVVQASEVLFVNFGEREAARCMELLMQLRQRGIAGELYPDPAKMKKQLKYANDKGVRLVALIGEAELESGQVTIKNMETGTQETLSESEFFGTFQA